MAVPKRKTSVSRKGKRRSHHAAKFKNIIEDKKSGEFRLSHHIDKKLACITVNKYLKINNIFNEL